MLSLDTHDSDNANAVMMIILADSVELFDAPFVQFYRLVACDRSILFFCENNYNCMNVLWLPFFNCHECHDDQMRIRVRSRPSLFAFLHCFLWTFVSRSLSHFCGSVDELPHRRIINYVMKMYVHDEMIFCTSFVVRRSLDAHAVIIHSNTAAHASSTHEEACLASNCRNKEKKNIK